MKSKAGAFILARLSLVTTLIRDNKFISFAVLTGITINLDCTEQIAFDCCNILREKQQE
jgi:hypothetical protein